ncbi:MAG: response regulator [Gammaproteobacteria bacterium]|nr:response regulator [Gammaproteobacteria bacterium]
MQQTTIHVLIVDDDKSDQDMLIDILDDCASKLDISTLDDGDVVMDYLYKKGVYEHAVLPDLILLDLNMPLKDGREVLREIKTDPNTCHIPVVILSTSINKIDICDSYAHGANAYVRKEVGLQNFMASIQHIEQFWMRTSILPSCCNQHSELA